MKKNKIVILVILLLLLLIAGGCNSENATDESIRSMGFPSLSDVPGGFSSVDAKSIDTGDWCEITYENSSGDFLSLDCYESGTFDIAFLMNYAESTEQMTIKDKEATVYKNLSDNGAIYFDKFNAGGEVCEVSKKDMVKVEEMYSLIEKLLLLPDSQ